VSVTHAVSADVLNGALRITHPLTSGRPLRRPATSSLSRSGGWRAAVVL